MSNRVIWLLAAIFIIVGGFTVATFYSKVYGRSQLHIFTCEKTDMSKKCRAQRWMNELLVKILPDKDAGLIKKFSPTPTK